MLSRTKISDSTSEEYAWDHRNRLVKVTFKDGMGATTKTVEHAYDVYNRWIRRTVDADGPGPETATDTFFAYDGYHAVLQFDGAEANDLDHRYLFGPAVDQILADQDVNNLSSAGNTLWGLADHLGTVRDVADTNEGSGVTSVANHRTYNSFGTQTSETNAAVDFIFGETGKMLEEHTGMNNHIQRWLRGGQWLSEDPIGFGGGDANLRRDVGNDPTNLVDPDGLETHKPGLPRSDEKKRGDSRPPVSNEQTGIFSRRRRPVYSLVPDRRGGWTANVDESDFTPERARLKAQEIRAMIGDAAISFCPYVGDYRDFYEAIEGKDMLTGEPLPWYSRGLTVVAAAVPFVPAAGVRRGLGGGLEAAEDAARAGRSVPDVETPTPGPPNKSPGELPPKKTPPENGSGGGTPNDPNKPPDDPADPIEEHHSDPVFLGGDKNQPKTRISRSKHRGPGESLHNDLNNFLRGIEDEAGNHMRPQRDNAGKKIRRNFSRDECLNALKEFYKTYGEKYPESARDFFKQHPVLE